MNTFLVFNDLFPLIREEKIIMEIEGNEESTLMLPKELFIVVKWATDA